MKVQNTITERSKGRQRPHARNWKILPNLAYKETHHNYGALRFGDGLAVAVDVDFPDRFLWCAPLVPCGPEKHWHLIPNPLH